MAASSSWREPNPPRMVEVRCRDCGKLLFKADGKGRVEIVCPDRRCRRYQTRQLQEREA